MVPSAYIYDWKWFPKTQLCWVVKMRVLIIAAIYVFIVVNGLDEKGKKLSSFLNNF